MSDTIIKILIPSPLLDDLEQHPKYREGMDRLMDAVLPKGPDVAGEFEKQNQEPERWDGQS